jgi:hypothetical protein
VMCELEGRGRKDVARQLNLPEGTLSSRLAAARKLLARRLTRRGLVLPAAFLGMAWGPGLARAAVPAPLIQSTTDLAAQVAVCGMAAPAIPAGVVALMKGALTAMWFGKIKIAIAVTLSLGVLGTGAWSLREAQAQLSEKPQVVAANAAEKPAKADKPIKKPQGPEVRGQVDSVDLDKKTLTLNVPVPGEKRTEEKTFPVAADAEILLIDVVIKTKKEPIPKGALADLIEGTGVAVRLDEDGKSIASIQAHGPKLSGKIKWLDAAKPSITIETKGGDKELIEHTLEVDKEAPVFIDDGIGKKGDPQQEGQLGDLTEGTRVDVQLTVNRKKVLAIRAQGGHLQGSVVGYDAGTRTLTVSVKEDGAIVDKALSLAKEAKVDGELAQGAHVAVQLAFADKAVATVVRVVDKDK